MKRFWILLVILILGLQYRLWVGENSLAELWGIKGKVTAQKSSNKKLQARNDALKAEVSDLKQGLDAIEERARSELGMIKNNETFYQLMESPEKSNSLAKEGALIQKKSSASQGDE